MIVFWIIIGIAINELVAYCVLDALDDERHSLRDHIHACPVIFGATLATQLWPVTAWLWWRRPR